MLVLLCGVCRCEDASLLAAVEVYHHSLDMEDFRDTLHRIASLAVGSSSGPVAAAAADEPATPAVFNDNDRATLQRASRAADFTDAQTDLLLQLAESADETVIAPLQVRLLHRCSCAGLCCCTIERACILQVYNIENDLHDLIDSLRRVLRRHVNGASSPGRHSNLHLMSDLAANGLLTGVNYAKLLDLLRQGRADVLAAMDKFKVHGSKVSLAHALNGIVDKDEDGDDE